MGRDCVSAVWLSVLKVILFFLYEKISFVFLWQLKSSFVDWFTFLRPVGFYEKGLKGLPFFILYSLEVQRLVRSNNNAKDILKNQKC